MGQNKLHFARSRQSMSFAAISKIPNTNGGCGRHLALLEQIPSVHDTDSLMQTLTTSGFAEGCCVWPVDPSSRSTMNGQLKAAMDWFGGQQRYSSVSSSDEFMFVYCGPSSLRAYLAILYSTQPQQWLLSWRHDELFGREDLIAVKVALNVLQIHTNQQRQAATDDNVKAPRSVDIEDLLPQRAEQACSHVFKRALDICDDGILLCGSDGSIIDANRKALEWFGEAVKPLCGHTKAISWLANIVHPDDFGAVTMRWRDLQAGCGGAHAVDMQDMQMIHADGRTGTFKCTVVKIQYNENRIDDDDHDEHENIQNWVFYIRDAQRMAREQRERQVEDSRARFLAEMSHEIRTPLSCIIGTTDLMRYTNLQREQAELVSTISTCSRQLFQLIENILDFSKIHERKLLLNPTVSVLEKVVYEAVQFVSPEIHRKDLDFFLNIDRQVPEWVVVDALRLRQVLTNLIGNAVKFTDDRTMVSVNVTLDGDGGAGGDDQATDKQSICLRFDIEDRGPGLAEGDNATLFDSYVQLNETIQSKFGGTGLGLAISRRLVSMMGGTVWFESGPPMMTGCKFIFTICCSPADPAEQRQFENGGSTNFDDTNSNLTMAKASRMLCEYLQSFVSRHHEHIVVVVKVRSPDLSRYISGILANTPGLSCSDTINCDDNDDDYNSVNSTRYIIISDDATPLPQLKAMIDVCVIGVIMLTRDEVKMVRLLKEHGMAAKTVRRPIYTPCLLKTLLECLVESQMAENIGYSNGSSMVLRTSTSGNRQSSHHYNNSSSLTGDLAIRHPLPHHIMIVDDNQINIQLMSRILCKLGYQSPLTAETGLQCLHLYRQHFGRVSCIFMDMEMPEMTGVEAAMAIRRMDTTNKDNIKDNKDGDRPHIIALTANAFPEDREECLRAGMCRYLSKPVRWSELEAELVVGVAGV